MRMTAQQAQDLQATHFKRDVIDSLIKTEARLGFNYLLIFKNRLSDSDELDLILDGFDVDLHGPNTLKISW